MIHQRAFARAEGAACIAPRNAGHGEGDRGAALLRPCPIRSRCQTQPGGIAPAAAAVQRNRCAARHGLIGAGVYLENGQRRIGRPRQIVGNHHIHRIRNAAHCAAGFCGLQLEGERCILRNRRRSKGGLQRRGAAERDRCARCLRPFDGGRPAIVPGICAQQRHPQARRHPRAAVTGLHNRHSVVRRNGDGHRICRRNLRGPQHIAVFVPGFGNHNHELENQRGAGDEIRREGNHRDID